MKLFSHKKRPVHLGPYPLERLKRIGDPGSQPPGLNGAVPESPRENAEPGELAVDSAFATYFDLFDQRRTGEIAPEAPVTTDPVEVAKNLKSGLYFLDADMDIPVTFNDPHTASAPHLQRLMEVRGQLDESPKLKSLNEDQFRHACAAQFGAITMVDDGIAKVLASLEASGQADNTVVIFTSDHGDMFGDHGLILKMFAHYDGCIRVPFTISGPGIDAGKSNSLICSLDLGDTILDLCDVDGYYGSQGKSLVPVLDDPTIELRDDILIEEDQIRDGLNAGVQPRMRTLITKDARITRYQNLDRHDLYDLDNDPDECENKWLDSDATSLRREMSDRLTESMIAHASPSFRPTYIA